MVARLRRELDIPVEDQAGNYGEFTVLVDGEPVLRGGALVLAGLVPSAAEVLDKVRARLNAG